MTSLDIDEAEEIAICDHVASQIVSVHRWYTKRLIVFEREGALLGFYYLDPASEMQEDQDRFETDPVHVFRVVGKEVVSVVYEPAPDEAAA